MAKLKSLGWILTILGVAALGAASFPDLWMGKNASFEPRYMRQEGICAQVGALVFLTGLVILVIANIETRLKRRAKS